MQSASRHKIVSAQKKVAVAAIAGLIASGVTAALGYWKYSPIIAWDTTAVIYLVWTWRDIWPMAPGQTKEKALMEDPGRAATDLLLLAASLVSLAAVGFLIIQSANLTSNLDKSLHVFIGLLSVVFSWAVVHTNFTLRYARLYYGDPEGGIDFNDEQPPDYKDFAYVAFTLGMTFQVSDTDLKTKAIRNTALKHAFLSYIFGTIIIATTINAIASLA